MVKVSFSEFFVYLVTCKVMQLSGHLCGNSCSPTCNIGCFPPDFELYFGSDCKDCKGVCGGIYMFLIVCSKT